MVSNAVWTAGNGSPPAGAIDRAQQHFLGAAAGGQQADADFDQAHVGFRRRADAVGVQADLAAAAQRQTGRRGDDRHRPSTSAPSSRPETRGPSRRSRPSCLPALRAESASGWRRRRNCRRRCRRRAPRNCATASATPACSIAMASPPIVFIFEWNSTQSTSSPRSTRLAPSLDCTTRVDVAGRAGRRTASAPGLPWRAAGPARVPRQSPQSSRTAPAPSRSPTASRDRRRPANCAMSPAIRAA